MRATDVGVCSNKLIPRVLHEWREIAGAFYGMEGIPEGWMKQPALREKSEAIALALIDLE